jgi:hypothetical protein
VGLGAEKYDLQMSAIVLTYHSHNISGTDYASNDHVALAADLRTLDSIGAHIVPLTTIVQAVASGELGRDRLMVGLSFDDGPRFDFCDFVHPRFGLQRGFLEILRDFQSETGRAQPDLHATSFVIASPHARRMMEDAEDCGYPNMPNWLGEDWWGEAVASGLMSIGNHSWDHVHHAVDKIVASTPVRDDFTQVTNYPDADREIRAAASYINSRLGGSCTLFAFPFGHWNDYLVNDYLPLRAYEHGMAGAFNTAGREIRSGDSIWNLPRLVCGEHWRSQSELDTILRN